MTVVAFALDRACASALAGIGGASTMMGTGVHSVDLLRFVLGTDVDEITALRG